MKMRTALAIQVASALDPRVLNPPERVQDLATEKKISVAEAALVVAALDALAATFALVSFAEFEGLWSWVDLTHDQTMYLGTEDDARRHAYRGASVSGLRPLTVERYVQWIGRGERVRRLDFRDDPETADMDDVI